MIRANAAQNISAVFRKELEIDLVPVGHEAQLLDKARGKMFAVRPRKPPLNPWSGSWKAVTTRLL